MADSPAANTRSGSRGKERSGETTASNIPSPTNESMGLKQRRRVSPRAKKTSGGKVDTVDTNVKGKTDETQAPSKWKKMAKRTIVALLFIAIMIGVVLSDHVVIIIVVAIFQTMVFDELVKVRQDVRLENRKIPLFRSLNWYGYFVAMFFCYGKDFAAYFGWNLLRRYHFYMTFCMYIGFFLGFVLQLATVAKRAGKDTSKRVLYKYQFGQLTWTLLIIFIVVFQLRFVMQHILEGVIWFVLPCSLVIMNDTSAYFCGFFMGKKFIKTQLTALSPNKTWEGFLGAAFLTCIFGWVVSGWLSTWPWFICPRRLYEADANLCTPSSVFMPAEFSAYGYSITARPVQIHFVFLSLFASLIAPFGGFLASGIKRAYKIDDFSSVIPGHGGFTDRMDCQLLMLFCTHVHYRTFVRVLPTTLAVLMESIRNLTGEEQASLLKELQGLVDGKGGA